MLQFKKSLLLAAFVVGSISSADPAYDLKDAIAKGNPKKVRQLLKTVSPDTLLENSSVPALVYAAEIGNPAVVKVLIDAKASLDARIQQDQFCKTTGCPTALITAACDGKKDVVKLLIEAHASLDLKTLEVDGSYKTIELVSAVACAANHEHRDIYDMLIAAGAKDEFPLHAAVHFADIERARSLISADIDVNQQDGYLYSPLMHAAKRGKVEIVRILLEAKATPGIPRKMTVEMIDGRERTSYSSSSLIGTEPIFLAIKGGHTEIVRLLLHAKADPNIKDISNKVPLWLAVEARNVELVKLLIDAGADVQVKSRGGESLLQLAKRMNADNEIVKMLTTSGTK